MRDMTKQAVAAIDEARTEIAGVEGMFNWMRDRLERNKEGDIAEVKSLLIKQKKILTKTRTSLNGAMFDDAFSPFGHDLKDE